MASAIENALTEGIRPTQWKGNRINQALAFVAKKAIRIVQNAFVDRGILEKCEITKVRHHKQSTDYHNLNFPFHP